MNVFDAALQEADKLDQKLYLLDEKLERSVINF